MGNPLVQLHEILSQKTRVLDTEANKNFVIFGCVVFIKFGSVMDGHKQVPLRKTSDTFCGFVELTENEELELGKTTGEKE